MRQGALAQWSANWLFFTDSTHNQLQRAIVLLFVKQKIHMSMNSKPLEVVFTIIDQILLHSSDG